jgi:predicted nuclease of predicted toxin-antitoxin system
VRFLIDQDVDAAVGQMLRRRGHECLTASQIGLSEAEDDDLGVWADQHEAALVSTDRQFGRRKMKNAIGRHVWLRCPDWEAEALLGEYLDEVVDRLHARADLTLRVSVTGIDESSAWT